MACRKSSPRPAIVYGDADYDRVDLAFGWGELWGSRLGLRAGIDNLLRDDTTQLRDTPQGAQIFHYRDRVAWLQLGIDW